VKGWASPLRNPLAAADARAAQPPSTKQWSGRCAGGSFSASIRQDPDPAERCRHPLRPWPGVGYSRPEPLSMRGSPSYCVAPRCVAIHSGTFGLTTSMLLGPFLFEESGIGLGNVGSRSPKPMPNPRPSAGEFHERDQGLSHPNGQRPSYPQGA